MRSETVLQGAYEAMVGTMNPASIERTRDVIGDLVRPSATGGRAREGLATRSTNENEETKRKEIDEVTSQVDKED